MSGQHGNARWKALRDDVNAKGQPLLPDPCDRCGAWELIPTLARAGIPVTCENLRAALGGDDR